MEDVVKGHVWVVQGTTGEQADRIKWVVDAWRTQEQATSRVCELHGLLGDMAGEDGHWTWTERRDREARVRCHARGDPRCTIDYTGTKYFAEQCELRGEPTATRTLRRSCDFWTRVMLTAGAVILNVAIIAGVWYYQPGRLILEWLR